MIALRTALSVGMVLFIASDVSAASGYGEEARCINASDARVECIFTKNQSRRSLLVKKLSFRCICPTCEIQIGGVEATATFTPEMGSERLELPVSTGFVKDQGRPFPIAGAATEAEGIIAKADAPISLVIKALEGSGIHLSLCRAWVTGTLIK